MFYRVLPSLLNCLSSVPAWYIYNIPNACQHLIFTYQHAKVIIIFQFGMPMCQKHANFLIWGASMTKSRPISQLFFKRIFQFFNFSIMLNICTFQEHLGNSRKFILQNKVFKLWHLKNFIKEKPYQPKTFDIVFNGAHRINQTIIQLV